MLSVCQRVGPCALAATRASDQGHVSIGTAPKDHETLRQVQALIGSLPTADSSEFRQEYMTVREHCSRQ